MQETDPAGYTSTTPNAVPVSVAAGGAASANFGDQTVGSISGTVFNDLNGNGVQDPGEPGLGGVPVQLIDPGLDGILGTADDVILETATTLPDGSYQFLGVLPGDYGVQETDPSGFTSATPNIVPVTVPLGGAGSANFGDQIEEPTAAVLRLFIATASDDEVTLVWETITEIDNLGFHLWRSSQPEAGYQRMNSTLIPSQALGTGGARYEFVDHGVPAGAWYYKLETISTTGQTDGWHGPISIRVGDTGRWRIYLPLLWKLEIRN